MKAKKHKFIAVFALMAALALWLLWPTGETVPVAKASRGVAAELVYATGVVQPTKYAVLSAEVAGTLWSALPEGSKVGAGQVVASLMQSKELAVLSDATAAKAKAERDLERAKTLWQKKSGSQESYQDAQTALERATAALLQAQGELSKRNLIAPISGEVLRVDGEIGEMVPQGRQIAVVGDPALLRVELEVDEEDIGRVALGQKALLRADAFPGQAFVADIYEITPQGEPSDKSYRVRASLGEGTRLPLGMTVEANIVLLEKQGVLLVPATAVVDGAVFKLEGRKLVRTSVKTGIVGLEKTEITEGISEGDMVVITPTPSLKDGTRITPALQGDSAGAQ
jgi:RND family efflux transporter MFP subunit